MFLRLQHARATGAEVLVRAPPWRARERSGEGGALIQDAVDPDHPVLGRVRLLKVLERDVHVANLHLRSHARSGWSPRCAWPGHALNGCALTCTTVLVPRCREAEAARAT